MSEKRHRVSRRQFLNYTLTGVGGFMAAGMLMPMVRFALDPVLRPTEVLEPSAVEDGDRARWSRRRSGSYGDSDGIQRSTRPD